MYILCVCAAPNAPNSNIYACYIPICVYFTMNITEWTSGSLHWFPSFQFAHCFVSPHSRPAALLLLLLQNKKKTPVQAGRLDTRIQAKQHTYWVCVCKCLCMIMYISFDLGTLDYVLQPYLLFSFSCVFCTHSLNFIVWYSSYLSYQTGHVYSVQIQTLYNAHSFHHRASCVGRIHVRPHSQLLLAFSFYPVPKRQNNTHTHTTNDPKKWTGMG